MTDQIITDSDIEQSGDTSLSPAYFAARRIVNAFVGGDDGWTEHKENLLEPNRFGEAP